MAALTVRRATTLAAALLLASAGPARAHAGLLSSSPAAGDTLRQPPGRLRLRFTEPVEASSSGLVLLGWDGRAVTLAPERDPGDVAALTAALPPLRPGGYRVQWRTVSADGHPVDGSFVFYVAGAAAALTAAPPERMPEEATSPAVRVVAAALRGMGVGALAALCGLLLFTTRLGASEDRTRRWAMALAWAAPLLLAAHAVAWAVYARGPGGAEPLRQLLLGTLAGRVEVARAALALLALWALALARRPGLALVLSLAALAASGATGHAAAIHPGWSVPAKAFHVAAVAVWLGGLAVLFATARRGDDLRALAVRVSSLSLAAVVVLTVSGVLQTLLFAPALGLLARSAYGAAILAKLIGLCALVAIGARNRYRLVPGLPAEDARRALRRAVTWELVVMSMVLLAAGLLAYLPVPRPVEDAHATHMEMN